MKYISFVYILITVTVLLIWWFVSWNLDMMSKILITVWAINSIIATFEDLVN